MHKKHVSKARDNASQEKYCPFIKKPDPQCFCIDMNGSKINMAMRFCLNEYRSCRIYHRLFMAERCRERQPDPGAAADAFSQRKSVDERQRHSGHRRHGPPKKKEIGNEKA